MNYIFTQNRLKQCEICGTSYPTWIINPISTCRCGKHTICIICRKQEKCQQETDVEKLLKEYVMIPRAKY